MSEEVHETPPTTPNFQTELAAQLAELMPEIIADGKVDVEKLKELLDGDAADTSERFGLFWPGKKRALRAAQEPTTATLRPDFENSKDWDTTKNVFIEGDNLEVLKILQKHYHAKIKMIYIDPPYNTGKDFVYPDNFKEGLDTYLEWTRQVNEEGKKLSTNAETEGRYHSNWLNMMYPRLKLARNLLSEDGVIFISIDDHEYANLKRMCDEVFGESNFEANFVWQRKQSPQRDATNISATHDYILVYSRRHPADRNDDSGWLARLLPMGPDQLERYKNPDNDPRGMWTSADLTINTTAKQRPNKYFPVTNPHTGEEVMPSEKRTWIFDRNTMERVVSEGRLWWGEKGTNFPRLKAFLSENQQGVKPQTVLLRTAVGDNQRATREVNVLFPEGNIFDTPKPTSLLRHLCYVANVRDGDIVLDFFAGSATTADAIIRMNAEDGEDRRFVMAQLPEPYSPTALASTLGYRTIAEASRERVRRVEAAVSAEYADQIAQRATPLDAGFRAYSLTDTNFSKWNVSSEVDRNQLEQHLFELQESGSADDSSADDLLSEILLKQGYSLTEQIAPVDVAGLNLRSVGDGIVLAYLNEQVKPTLEQLRAVVDADPARLIVLEDAFQGDDQLKTNLAQLCKSKGIELWTA